MVITVYTLDSTDLRVYFRHDYILQSVKLLRSKSLWSNKFDLTNFCCNFRCFVLLNDSHMPGSCDRWDWNGFEGRQAKTQLQWSISSVKDLPKKSMSLNPLLHLFHSSNWKNVRKFRTNTFLENLSAGFWITWSNVIARFVRMSFIVSRFYKVFREDGKVELQLL